MMAPKTYFFIFLFVFSSFMGVHCGRTPNAIPLVEPDPNIGAPNPSGGAPVYYPHAKNFKAPVNHGAAYQSTLQNGQDPNSSLCILCHNLRKEAPTCISCHPLFPHMENWKDPINHGAYVRDNGTAGCATDCHGADLASGLSRISCQSCHHPEGWAAADSHGLYVIQNDKESCKSCHGEDYKGGVFGPSCYNANCHATYPHPSGWAQVEKHGFFAHDQGKEDCKDCHGQDFQGGISNVSCYNASCHATYPHPDNWRQETHGSAALGEGKNACKTCHGDDFTGGISGVSCYANCHASFPHNEQWPQPDQHGVVTLLNGKEGCKLCHGNDFQGGNSNISCYNANCHTTYPHNENWVQAAQHGVAAYGEGKNNCNSANCHSPDFSGREPLIKGCVNQDCHPNYPHQLDPNWMAEQNPTHMTTFIAKVRAGDNDACTECHGQDYDRVVNGVSCTAAGCHPSGVTHRNIPEPWADGQGHGAYYVSQYSNPNSVDVWINASCGHCHGTPVTFTLNDTLEGLAQQSDCYRCHWAFPHVRVEYGNPRPNGRRRINDWAPASEHLAHLSYIFGNPLLVDENGNHQAQFVNGVENPAVFEAIENTCGGSEGNCHFNGRGSPVLEFRAPDLCTSYCHIPLP
ncbi:MAG TPA: hypothetical protein DDW49_07965 [Deltaproteobacteria bacterium]|nr:MAG: hypothetical protein A2048_07290 [Deltaproteobacteria bacterium GWA2_45_12]HBF13299.1 hypothetical protein [Deltaproteobacteria bacterium]